MKIKAEHYQYLKFAIDNLDKQRIAEHKALELGKHNFICDTLYPYLNDDHIHTALKQIIKELKL